MIDPYGFSGGLFTHHVLAQREDFGESFYYCVAAVECRNERCEIEEM